MLRNYLKIAYRNLVKHPSYSAINVFGLSLGIACFTLIVLYLNDEYTFDTMHKKGDNIYRVVENKTNKNGVESKIASIAYQVSEQAKSNIPGIEETTRIVNIGRAVVSDPLEDQKQFYEQIWLAEPSFFDMFSFPLLLGDRESVLSSPYSVALTASSAIKIFGSTDIIGKILKMDRDTALYQVTGVLKDFPVNSHINFSMLFSENSLYNDQYRNYIGLDWTSNNFATYFLLSENQEPALISSKLNDMVAEKRDDQLNYTSTFSIQNIEAIHFNSEEIEQSLGTPGNKQFSNILLIIGFFLLLIACINYINLSTARFTTRVKDIAIRKVAGARRKELIGQFMIEAFLLTFIGIIGAGIIVYFFLPSFNLFVEKELSLMSFGYLKLSLFLLSILSVVGILSGLYPALIQSKMRPFDLLKNKVSLGKGSISMRKALVIFQFTLSIVMIAATMVIFLQLKYIENKDLGFNQEQLLVMDINSSKIRSSALEIKDEMNALAAVKKTSITSRVPGEWKGIPKAFVTNGNSTEESSMYYLAVDDQFTSTFEIDLISGSNFNYNNAADSSSVLLNETAANMLGISEAQNQLIEIPRVDFYGNIRTLDNPHQVRVKAIVNDFNFQSLHEPIAPVVLAYHRNPIHRIDYFTAKIDLENQENTLAEMEKIIHKFDENHLFEYHFLNTQMDDFYLEDKRRHAMIITSAILTILIACLGLFGLVSFSSLQRRKEIGIRKVLGASVNSITKLLVKNFIFNILIAILISLPIAYFIMSNWLNNYAYKITIGWWFFIVPGVIALLIALITVSIQTINAASSNPVHSLRAE